MRCLGSSWGKICHSCAEEFIVKSLKVTDEIKKVLQERLKELEANRDKWNREALVGSLN